MYVQALNQTSLPEATARLLHMQSGVKTAVYVMNTKNPFVNIVWYISGTGIRDGTGSTADGTARL